MRKIKIAPNLVPQLLQAGIAAVTAPSAAAPRTRTTQARGRSRNAARPTGSARGASASTSAENQPPCAYPDSWRPRQAQARGGGAAGLRSHVGVTPSASSAATGAVSSPPRGVHAAGRTPQLLEDQRQVEAARIAATQGDRSYSRGACPPSATAADQMSRERAAWNRMWTAQAAHAQASGAR